MPGAVKLTLLVGPLPVPAPQEVVLALSAARVVMGSGDS